LNSGIYILQEDVVFPYEANLILQPGVEIYLSNATSIFLRGNLLAKGTERNPIKVSNLNEKPFGSFAIKGTTLKPSKVELENFFLEGGSESIIDGTYFSGQFSVHIGEVNINKSSFSKSFSDDGMNIKLSTVQITESVFTNNSGDQVDLDFVKGYVSQSVFTHTNTTDDIFTDGLDVSGSILEIKNNKFSKMTDKGLSIGEKSLVNVYQNEFNDNNIGIALKDGSNACLDENKLSNNQVDASVYIKKNMYKYPVLFKGDQFLNSNLKYLECDKNNFLSFPRTVE